MKNIHLLPTDKPSRLIQKRITNELKFSSMNNPQLWNNINIYITSDEEIKEGDAVIHNFGMGYELEIPCDSDNLKSNTRSKIILTTDQDLITDGVQAIDDEFLEWFVKNPSCESVEIDKIPDLQSYNEKTHKCDLVYTIIIPKEEPKQEITGIDDNRPKPNYCYAKEQGYDETTCIFPSCHCGLPVKKSKQETLEEAAERLVPGVNRSFGRDLFITGAKWQAERMYNKKEVATLCQKAMMYSYMNLPPHLTPIKGMALWLKQNIK